MLLPIVPVRESLAVLVEPDPDASPRDRLQLAEGFVSVTPAESRKFREG